MVPNQHPLRGKILLLGVFIISTSLLHPHALARRTNKQQHIPHLQAEIPRLDTSIQSRYFKIRVERKVPLLYLKDSTGMLQGHAGTYDLRADTNKHILRSSVTSGPDLYLLSTRQHAVRAKFFIDLQRLEAQYAPNVARLMEAEITKSRLKSAFDTIQRERQLNVELALEHPKAQILILPSNSTHSANPNVQLEAALARAKQVQTDTANNANAMLAAALKQARMTGGRLPAYPQIRLQMPPFQELPAGNIKISKGSQTDTTVALRSMNGELQKTTDLRPTAAQLDADLLSARNKVLIKTNRQQSDLDTILTSVRSISTPSISSQLLNNQAESKSSSKVIEWDAWHANFARLARPKILQKLNKFGNPAGKNTIEVSVSASGHVTAELKRAGNTAFDQAILEAYRSLDGSASLQFPKGSCRREIRFLVDNDHAGKGVPSGVK